MGGGQETPAQTTQINKTELPAWVDSASNANYERAREIAAKPFTAYTGGMVAGTSPDTIAAYNMFRNTMGTGQVNYGAASGGYKGVLNTQLPSISAPQIGTDLNARDVTGKNFTDYDMAGYMNPYIDEVINKSMARLNDSRVQALQGNASDAIKAKAFGGDRSAIIDAVTNSETAKAAGELSANLYKGGWDTASGLITSDANRNIQGALANQNKDLSLAGLDLQKDTTNANLGMDAQKTNLSALLSKLGLDTSASAGLLSAGDAQNRARMGDFSGLLSIGSAEQGQTQAELDAARSEWDRGQNWDIDQLNLLLSSLGMSPYGKSETATKTGTQGQSSTDPAQIGAGVLSMLPMLIGLSDRNEKTDIKRLGKDPATGLPLYAYRYKGDPKTYPKVVGPMAQDIAKKFPGMTGEVGGRMVIPGPLAMIGVEA